MSLEPPPIPEGFLARWCDTLAESSESPPGAFLPTGLALLSTIVGPRLVMRWGVAHEERTNLWILNVGMSALARKTSGLSGLYTAVSWLYDAAGSIRTLPVSRISDAGIVSALDVVSADTAVEQKLEYDITAKGHEVRKIPDVVRPVPVSWLAVFNEVSPVWTDVGSTYVMDAQRALLQIYDGRLSSSTKATNVPAQECFVAAVGNIPPGVLKDQTTLGMLSSGWVGRWLVIPTPEPVDIVSFPMPNGTDPLLRLQNEVKELHALAEGSNRVVVNDVWTEEAIAVRHVWYERYHNRYARGLADDPFETAAAELFGRLQATAVKVATLLAVSRQGRDIGRLSDVLVEAQDVEWASKVIDASMRYITQTLREVGADSTSPAGKVEARIIRYLEKSEAVTEATAVPLRILADRVKGGIVSREQAMRSVEALMQSGDVKVGAASGNRTRMIWLEQ